MLNNLSIKSRLVFVIAFLSLLLLGMGIMGLASLDKTNASLKTVYEDRLVAMGQLERISALINRNQIIVGEAVSGQLSAFPEDVIEGFQSTICSTRKPLFRRRIDWTEDPVRSSQMQISRYITSPVSESPSKGRGNC